MSWPDASRVSSSQPSLRSLSISDIPSSVSEISGGRPILRAWEATPSFSLSQDYLDAVRRRRAQRMYERELQEFQDSRLALSPDARLFMMRAHPPTLSEVVAVRRMRAEQDLDQLIRDTAPRGDLRPQFAHAPTPFPLRTHAS